MQFSLRCNEEIWELTDHEKEVTILAICWEIMAKFYMVPIYHNGFGAHLLQKTAMLLTSHKQEVKASIPSIIHKNI